VPAFRIVEALNIIEDVGLGVFSRSVDSACGPSVFNDEKKLSIAALSQTLPDLLIEQTTP
jgi:hypothetical protein